MAGVPLPLDSRPHHDAFKSQDSLTGSGNDRFF
jgi:hypothetical protein